MLAHQNLSASVTYTMLSTAASRASSSACGGAAGVAEADKMDIQDKTSASFRNMVGDEWVWVWGCSEGRSLKPVSPVQDVI